MLNGNSQLYGDSAYKPIPNTEITYDAEYVDAMMDTENPQNIEALKSLQKGVELQYQNGPLDYMALGEYKKSIKTSDNKTCYSLYQYGSQLQAINQANGSPISDESPEEFWLQALSKNPVYFEVYYA
jgi:hypothetical protein